MTLNVSQHLVLKRFEPKTADLSGEQMKSKKDCTLLWALSASQTASHPNHFDLIQFLWLVCFVSARKHTRNPPDPLQNKNQTQRRWDAELLSDFGFKFPFVQIHANPRRVFFCFLQSPQVRAQTSERKQDRSHSELHSLRVGRNGCFWRVEFTLWGSWYRHQKWFLG